jgi:hypothetical protein
MKIAVVGSRGWEDYPTLIRKLTVEIEDWIRLNPDENTLMFLHTGAKGAETMVTEYVGKIESLAKQNGRKITDRVIYSQSSDRDRELVESNEIDRAIIFAKRDCKRSQRFAKITEGLGIPTLYVVE